MSTLQSQTELELELENELEQELEQEQEQETELEHELSQELEQELEQEFEGAHETELEHVQEGEHEAFFNSLSAMADRGGRSQALRRIALAAARSALRAQKQAAPAIEGEMELEALGELELEFIPIRQNALPGQMEHLGHAAAEAETEQEAAEHFLPLIGLAAKFVLPKLAGALAKKVGGKLVGKMAGKVAGNLARRVGGRLARQVAGRAGKLTQQVGRQLANRVRKQVPALNRAVANTARTLWRNRTTRPLVNTIPATARKTMVQLARRAAAGRPATPQAAVRLYARNTARTLANPGLLARTYRRSTRLDSQYHRRNRRLIGRPAPGSVPASADPSYQPGYNPGAAGGFIPGASGNYVPGATEGYGPVPTSGGTGCRCQCGGGAANFAAGTPFGQSAGAGSAGAATCPTCGRA